jgi:alpha-1,2-mannosyltransferase
MLKFLYIVTTFSFFNVLFILLFIGIIYLIQRKLRRQITQVYSNTRVVSFLHPFCNDCGGGEKVLWKIVEALTTNATKKDGKIKINILCGIKDDASLIKNNLKNRFEIDLTSNDKGNVVDIELVRLKSANLIRPKSFLTMLLQIFGQIVLAFEIVSSVYSDTIIDTTGLPFTYIVLRLLGRAKVVAYVHYPFISDDMIRDIKGGVEGVHSRGLLSRFKALRYAKVFYYYLILAFYKLNGLCVDFAFTNSSWTNNHMKKIWTSTDLKILYPPCSTQLYESHKRNEIRSNTIVSCAQFRPEKKQKMQIDILNKLKNYNFCKDLKLCIIGSIRDEADKKIFDDLQEYVIQSGLKDDVELCPNLPLGEVKRKFENAKIGLHTMRDEHFGISVIEMMASGLITVAHNSAGPLNDIIGPADYFVGLLAESKSSIMNLLIFI